LVTARDDYLLAFLALDFFLVDTLAADFLAPLAADLLTAAAGGAERLPFPNADSQPCEYFLVAPTRTIVTAVTSGCSETALWRPPWLPER
jgi:hypothetical protein